MTMGLPIFNKKIPASLIAIILTTFVCTYCHLPIETIGSKFGSIPSRLPTPHFPEINLRLLIKMFPSAMTIALLGAVESLLSATVADGMAKTKHNSNVELIAQGLGNIISPFFLGIPATGGIVRTAANIRFGGNTPISALVHCLTLVLIMLFFSKYASLIPMAALAGILVVVSWNMSEIKTFKQTLKTTKNDILVLLCTFILTVLTNLTTAIEVGIILSALSVIQRTAKASSFTLHKAHDLKLEIEDKYDTGEIEVIQLKGALFFGSIDKFKKQQ